MNDKIEVGAFTIIGIAVRTTNENGQAVIDLGKLWNRFYAENISSVIPNKAGNDIYVVYTDYMNGHKGPYTSIIGYKVNSLDRVPDGLIGRRFYGGQYKKFLAKGKMPHALIRQWQEIWSNDKEIKRKYTADFEVYGRGSRDPENAEVDIYISVK